MHYYVSSYLGLGTAGDPYVPLGAQGQWSAIDLRPDSSLPTGGCLLAVPVRADEAGMIYLGAVEDADTPSATLKAALSARLLVTLSADTIRGAIAELLLQHARLDGTRWKPLMPAGRWYEWFLGDLEWRRPLIAGGSAFDETWTRADLPGNLDADLDWTLYAGSDWGIVSNAARIAVSAENQARAEVDLATVNHLVRARIAALSLSGTGNVGVTCRKDSTTTQTFYYFSIWGTPNFRLYKVVAGTFTQLGGSDSRVPAVNDVITVQAVGSTIRGLINGANASMSPQTDTAIAGNQRGGIRAFIAIGDAVSLDDWHAEDIAFAQRHSFRDFPIKKLQAAGIRG